MTSGGRGINQRGSLPISAFLVMKVNKCSHVLKGLSWCLCVVDLDLTADVHGFPPGGGRGIQQGKMEIFSWCQEEGVGDREGEDHPG